jgi:hypothetical protein
MILRNNNKQTILIHIKGDEFTDNFIFLEPNEVFKLSADVDYDIYQKQDKKTIKLKELIQKRYENK